LRLNFGGGKSPKIDNYDEAVLNLMTYELHVRKFTKYTVFSVLKG